jgi:RNA polymerase sigma factor (sigma-70 family)
MRSTCGPVVEPQAVELATDAELLTWWATGGGSAALEPLVRRHGAMVLGVCRRMLGDSPDADDAFQATFLVLVRKAKSLDRPEQVAGWLHRVALRVARKARAERARRHAREVVIVDVELPTPPEQTRELREELDEELNRLPEKYRLPIVLCELEGRTLEEAAELLGWPKGTVAGRLSRGRDLLRRRLSRRRGLMLPLFLVGGVPPSEPLVGSALQTATAADSGSRAVLLADLALCRSRSLVGIVLLLLFAGGALAGGAIAAWNARAHRGCHAPPAFQFVLPVAAEQTALR